MGIKLPFYDEYIEFSDTVLKYNDLRSNYVLLANSTVSSALNIFLEFEEKYRNNGKYEEYIENLIFLIDGIIDKAIDFSLFVLMQYGVDSYNHDRLISYICNGEDSIYDKMGVSETISKLSNAIDEICGVQD